MIIYFRQRVVAQRKLDIQVRVVVHSRLQLMPHSNRVTAFYESMKSEGFSWFSGLSFFLSILDSHLHHFSSLVLVGAGASLSFIPPTTACEASGATWSGAAKGRRRTRRCARDGERR